MALGAQQRFQQAPRRPQRKRVLQHRAQTLGGRHRSCTLGGPTAIGPLCCAPHKTDEALPAASIQHLYRIGCMRLLCVGDRRLQQPSLLAHLDGTDHGVNGVINWSLSSADSGRSCQEWSGD
jgi:hypothetical protein